MPFWIDELETNCCRGVHAWSAFGSLDVDIENLRGPYFPLPATVARQWWRHAKGRLRYSEVLQRFVAMPE